MTAHVTGGSKIVVLSEAEYSAFYAARGGVESPVIIQQSNFTGGSYPNDWFVSTELGGTIDFSNEFARGTYPITDGNPGSHVNISIPVPADIYDIYIQFRARMPGPGYGGCKFCKVHGLDNDPVGYANATFGTQAGTGTMAQVSFGDGSGTTSDTAQVLNFTGTGHVLGRNEGTAVISTPQAAAWTETDWGTEWHDFKIRCKFNTGTTSENEVADGAFYVEIDGNVYMNATNLFNRNPNNGAIEKVTLFNAAQNDPESFIIDYDNVIISTGGFA